MYNLINSFVNISINSNYWCIRGEKVMKFLFGIMGLLGILILSVYLLNKISSRKANSFNLEDNNNLSQFQENDNQNGPRL